MCHVFPGLNLLYTDPAHGIVWEGQDLDYLLLQFVICAIYPMCDLRVPGIQGLFLWNTCMRFRFRAARHPLALYILGLPRGRSLELVVPPFASTSS